LITVTGSTGRLGEQVARRLSDLGMEQRLLVRDPARAPRLPGTHLATEEHLRSVGVAYTILRDNIYADFTPHFIGQDGNIRGPAGDGELAEISKDIPEVTGHPARSLAQVLASQTE
jgi:uncharacterized protein YbjT (DUF2867 family)